MQKQKLSDMILARIKQKRQQQERNLPHYEVLRLQATFEKEKNQALKKQLSFLEKYLQNQRDLLEKIENQTQDLDNTGRKAFPRIIIKPDFIASQKIESKFKEFYRKSANSFLRTEILRRKDYELTMASQQKLILGIKSIGQLQKMIEMAKEEDNNKLNKRRLAILKQEVRIRLLLQEQERIKLQMLEEARVKEKQAKEYNQKKEIVQSSQTRIINLQSQIQKYKNQIEDAFSPKAYRQYYRKAFSFQIKNQILQNSLNKIKSQLEEVLKLTQKIEVPKDKGIDNREKSKAVIRSRTENRGMRRFKTQISNKITCLSTDQTQLAASYEFKRRT